MLGTVLRRINKQKSSCPHVIYILLVQAGNKQVSEQADNIMTGRNKSYEGK